MLKNHSAKINSFFQEIHTEYLLYMSGTVPDVDGIKNTQNACPHDTYYVGRGQSLGKKKKKKKVCK